MYSLKSDDLIETKVFRNTSEPLIWLGLPQDYGIAPSVERK
jgi:hypothetical protein